LLSSFAAFLFAEGDHQHNRVYDRNASYKFISVFDILFGLVNVHPVIHPIVHVASHAVIDPEVILL
jgi:hypothetical protein